MKMTKKMKLQKLLQEEEGADLRVSAMKAHMKLLLGHQEAGPAAEKSLNLKIVREDQNQTNKPHNLGRNYQHLQCATPWNLNQRASHLYQQKLT